MPFSKIEERVCSENSAYTISVNEKLFINPTLITDVRSSSINSILPGVSFVSDDVAVKVTFPSA